MTTQPDAPAGLTPPCSPRPFTRDQLLIFLAWEAGELSERQAARLLNLDWMTARDWREVAIDSGVALAYRLPEK
jgi:hypothetical protein